MDDLALLRHLIETTEGAAAQLALAQRSWAEGRQDDAVVHCSITADAISTVHPDLISDPVALSAALVRYFAPPRVN